MDCFSYYYGWSFSVWFGFYKKKPNWFKKKTKIGSNRLGLVRFFRTKIGSNRPVLIWLGFSVWLGFFQFGFGLIWFFWFQAYKTEIKPNSNRFNQFFFTVRIFRLFFSSFFGLIDFSIFLLTPTLYHFEIKYEKKNCYIFFITV